MESLIENLNINIKIKLFLHNTNTNLNIFKQKFLLTTKIYFFMIFILHSYKFK